MAREYPLKSVWHDENFAVQKGVIKARTTISGADIGPGIIYYPISANLTHRIAGSLDIVESLVIPGGNLSCLWNAGGETEIVNLSAHPKDIFRVAIRYDAELMAELPEEDIGLATTIFLHGDMAEAFKSSLKVDLEAIRLLVPESGGSPKPSQEDIVRASIAKQDLELKLWWFSKEMRRLRTSLSAFRAPGFGNALGALPPPGLIDVNVNTKDACTGMDVNGCVVWFNYSGYGSNTANAISFLKLSTPTTHKLSVSIVNMWAEKGGKTGKQRQISIGRGGTSPNSQSVDLVAP
jgi:hypothetical protein